MNNDIAFLISKRYFDLFIQSVDIFPCSEIINFCHSGDVLKSISGLKFVKACSEYLARGRKE